jgi:hypothetical protein
MMPWGTEACGMVDGQDEPAIRFAVMKGNIRSEVWK